MLDLRNTLWRILANKPLPGSKNQAHKPDESLFAEMHRNVFLKSNMTISREKKTI